MLSSLNGERLDHYRLTMFYAPKRCHIKLLPVEECLKMADV